MVKNLLEIRENLNKNNRLNKKFKNAENIKFAHNSEKEFSKILDFYRIKWEYEPKTFTLRFDRKGNPTVSFTPDFYLPDLDLYIELTTLNQKLVTKKNYKIKKLKELYPDINIKLFYKKDYISLLFKYLNK
ncbi:MAG: hypothetical protein COT09_01540 [Candidatus Hydromicrobium americanum]|jgi:bifunctional protein TilS/HprT|nr:MAG: hypothetical protein COT09_01540 [Candidatus Hydromicrobium americanum]